MASITQDMRFRLSLIEYAEVMASLKPPSNTIHIDSMFIVGNNRYDGSWDSS